jgi:hypothetical protein
MQLPGASVEQSGVLIMECKAVPCPLLAGSWLVKESRERYADTWCWCRTVRCPYHGM